MSPNTIIKLLLTIIATSTLLACGGGGGSSSPSQTSQPTSEPTAIPTSTPTTEPTATPTPTPTPTAAPSISGKYMPEGDAVLVFAGQDNATVGGTANYTNGYVENVGTPSGITHYVSFQFPTRAEGFDPEFDWNAGPMHLKAYTDSTTLNGTIMHVGVAMANVEDSVANGSRDAFIAQLVQFLSDYDDFPFILRLGYEFDASHNSYDPTQWKAAWIRIVDTLRNAGITNFATMMHANGIDTSIETWEEYWPGDDYVDWVAYSYWSEVPSTASLDFARQKGKPVCLCEVTPLNFDLANDDGNVIWSDWFTPFFNHIENNRDIIRAVSYINTNWPTQQLWSTGFFSTTNATIQSNSIVETNWLQKMAEERYIHTPTGVYDLIDFTPAP